MSNNILNRMSHLLQILYVPTIFAFTHIVANVYHKHEDFFADLKSALLRFEKMHPGKVFSTVRNKHKILCCFDAHLIIL
jgi:hypothetical protein